MFLFRLLFLNQNGCECKSLRNGQGFILFYCGLHAVLRCFKLLYRRGFCEAHLVIYVYNKSLVLLITISFVHIRHWYPWYVQYYLMDSVTKVQSKLRCEVGTFCNFMGLKAIVFLTLSKSYGMTSQLICLHHNACLAPCGLAGWPLTYFIN